MEDGWTLQGHELANHLMEDEAAYKLTTEQFEAQLVQVDQLLQPHWCEHQTSRKNKFNLPLRAGSLWVTPR